MRDSLATRRERNGKRQEHADRALRGVLGHVSQGRITGSAAKAQLALVLLDGLEVNEDVRKLIENL